VSGSAADNNIDGTIRAIGISQRRLLEMMQKYKKRGGEIRRLIVLGAASRLTSSALMGLHIENANPGRS
jgi:hypothetical protein